MMRSFDNSVKLLMDKLEEKNLMETTIIAFFSDNGGSSNAQKGASNYPLQGGKSSLYEGGVKVPAAIMWKGVIPAGTVYKSITSSLDVISTIAILSGADISSDRPLDGRNIVPYLTGEITSKIRDYWIVKDEHGGGMMMVRDDGFKFLSRTNTAE